jgi:SAM-dependent methyltransferase
MASDHYHTYILDPENIAEMARLELQAQLLTDGMGGLLPELGNILPADCLRILDLACGPGEWVRELASAFPKAKVTGLDISHIMSAYAQAVAQEKRLENARFAQGSLLEPLKFLDGSFDLLNARLLLGVIHRDRWPYFLQECQRVLRSGGRLRLTEGSDPTWQTNKAACEKMNLWVQEVCFKAGYGFATSTVSGMRMKDALSDLLAEAGWYEINVNDYQLDCSFGSPLAADQRRNSQIVWKQAEPLLLRSQITTKKEFTETYEAMYKEMAEVDFKGIWYLNTISARKA